MWGTDQGTQTVNTRLPAEPLPMQLWRAQAHFVWQRDPLTAATPGQGHPKLEKHGPDLVLPYWQGGPPEPSPDRSGARAQRRSLTEAIPSARGGASGAQIESTHTT